MGRQWENLGETGEGIAARWARRQGWHILARRFRVGHRDIDLIVRRGSTVAFVEVKTRSAAWFGGPISAVGRAKRHHLTRAATIWIDRHGSPEFEYRFDVIGVLVDQSGVRIAHVPDAFTALLGRTSRR